MGHDDDRDLLPPMGNSQFDVVRRGYDRAQVDDTFEAMQADLQIVTADRDATTSQAASLARQLEASRREVEDFREQLRRLSKPPTSVEGMSERLQRMLRLAQDEAAEIKARAETAAEQTMARAEDEIGTLRERYQQMIAEVDSRRAEIETEREQILAGAQTQADETVRAAEQRDAELDSESQQRRARAEEDFEITMSARRSEAMQALAEERETSTSEAHRRVSEATDEANRLRTEADGYSQQTRSDADGYSRQTRSEADGYSRQTHSDADEAAQRQLAEADEAAQRQIAEAEERSTAMVDDARGRVEQLRLLRHQVAEQLLSMRSTLDDAFRQLGQLPAEETVLSGGDARTGSDAATSDDRPETVSSEGRSSGEADTVPAARSEPPTKPDVWGDYHERSSVAANRRTR